MTDKSDWLHLPTAHPPTPLSPAPPSFGDGGVSVSGLHCAARMGCLGGGFICTYVDTTCRKVGKRPDGTSVACIRAVDDASTPLYC